MTTTTRAPGRTSTRRRRAVAVVGAAVALVLVASGCVVNGTWTALTLAAPTPSALGEVACVSDTWCLALGSGVQVWDGTTWSTRAAPTTTFPGAIESMDCFAVDRCAAIEERFDSWADEEHYLLLFDGTSWTEAPGLGDLGYGDPNLLSCGTGGCVVADTWDRMITWDGTTVTVDQQVEPIYAIHMDCVATDDCLAISGDTSHWDGSAWTEVAEGAPEINELSGHLACASTTDRCLTIGANSDGVNRSMTWDGVTWTELPLPAGAGSWFSDLSCVSSFECVATSFDLPSGGAAVLTFIGGTWYLGPTPPGGPDARYDDVSCIAQTCIAVGRGTPPGGGADAGIASRYHWTYP